MKKRIYSLSILISLVFSLGVVGADSLENTYSTNTTLLPGMIVALTNKNANSVEPLSNTNISNTTGVVIPLNQSNFVISSNNQKNQQVVVAHSGRYNVLVSDQNGLIKTGQYLSASSIDGITEQATSSQKFVIGQAEESFSGSGSSVIQQQTLTNSLGQKQIIDIGLIEVDVRLGPNPVYLSNSSDLPSFLTNLYSTIATKPVSPFRMYLSTASLLVTFFIGAILIYGGVKTSIVSIGRNPLAKRAVLKQLIITVSLGVIAILIGLLAVYLILH